MAPSALAGAAVATLWKVIRGAPSDRRNSGASQVASGRRFRKGRVRHGPGSAWDLAAPKERRQTARSETEARDFDP